MADQPESGMLIVGATGAGWTSVEALGPEDGVARWGYEPHRALGDVHCAAETVLVSLYVPHGRDLEQPAAIVALRASDGAELWRTDAKRLRWRLRWLRFACWLRIAFGEFSLSAARHAAGSLRLAGRIALAADGDVLTANSGPVLFGFDAATGAFRWVRPPPSWLQRRVLAMHAGLVCVTGARYGLEALDAGTGKSLWTNERLGEPRDVAFDGTSMYVHCHGRVGKGQAVATLNAGDGTLLRTLNLWSSGRWWDEERVVALDERGIVYLLRDRRLRAVRLEDEQELWRTEPFEPAPEDDAPEVFLMHVAVAERYPAYGYKVRRGMEYAVHTGALDPASGATLWRWRGTQHPQPGHEQLALAAAFGNVYLSTSDRLYAFRGDDGALLWTSPAGFDVVRIVPALAVSETA